MRRCVTTSADSPKALSEMTRSHSAPTDWERHRMSLCGRSLKFHIMQHIIGFADEGDAYCWAELRGLVKRRPIKAPPIMVGAPSRLKGRRRGVRGVEGNVGDMANYQARLWSILMVASVKKDWSNFYWLTFTRAVWFNPATKHNHE